MINHTTTNHTKQLLVFYNIKSLIQQQSLWFITRVSNNITDLSVVFQWADKWANMYNSSVLLLATVKGISYTCIWEVIFMSITNKMMHPWKNGTKLKVKGYKFLWCSEVQVSVSFTIRIFRFLQHEKKETSACLI